MAGLFNQFRREKLPGRDISLPGANDVWQFDPNPPAKVWLSAHPLTAQVPVPNDANSGDIGTSELTRNDYFSDLADATTSADSWRYRLEMRRLDLVDGIQRSIQREVAVGNGFNFVPVVFGTGIIAYFTAASEPLLSALVVAFVAFITLALRLQSRGGTYLAWLTLALFFGGMVAAKLEVTRAATPVPLSQITGQITGIVLEVDQNQRGSPRYLIKPLEIEGLLPEQLPVSVRLSASSSHAIAEIGMELSGLARMQPISGPAFPGSFDFAFASWMEGLGMSGFFMGAPSVKVSDIEPSLAEVLQAKLGNARSAITDRIRAGLPGEAGDIAAALITGNRTGLSEETQESLRRSGLAHILAISGLHMALVTHTVIWIIRSLLVFVPGLADQYPIKKWAVISGFLAATIYLLLSGASVATQRAWLMISVMLAASLLDRQAITMRSVAIAALIILAVSPSSLFQPGFQMSFAAVAALVAVYRDWNDHRMKRPEKALAGGEGMMARTGRYFGGLAGTSLIAGLATTLFALWHFHRVAPMGVVSNLAAMPLVSLFVMPLSLGAMVLMPFGFERLALQPLGMAIEGVVAVSDKVNSYEMDFETGAKPLLLLVCSGLFLVVVCGLRTRLRILGVVPFAGILVFSAIKPDIPDILIAQDGRAIAVKSALLAPHHADWQPGGKLSLLYPNRNKFVTGIWQRAYSPGDELGGLPEAISCSKDSCEFQVGVRQVSLIYDPDLLPNACRNADILLAPRLWWVNCSGREPELVLKRGDFERLGVHALHFDGDGIRLETGWPDGSKDGLRRPWLQRVEIPFKPKPKPTEPDLEPSFN